MKFNEFKNMMLCFGTVAHTQKTEIKRGILKDVTYPKNIVYRDIIGSFSDDHAINIPEWIKIYTLECLEEILGKDFNLDNLRKIIHPFWFYRKIVPGKGRYEGFGLGESCILNTYPIEKEDLLEVEIMNCKNYENYYRFTVKYKGKKKVYYVPLDGVYNRELREVFPIY